MGKKATTGGPTHQKRTAEQKEKAAYLSRAAREARMQRRVLLGAGTALAIVVIILLVGIVYDGIILPNRAVAVVDGQSITTTDFQARVRFVRWQTGSQLARVAAVYGPQALTDENSPFYRQFVQLQPGQEYLLGDQVLNEMVEEILIRKEAETRGVVVDAEMIEEQVQNYFGYDPNPATPAPTVEPSVTPTPVVSPTPSPEPTATEAPEATAEPSATPLPTVEPQPTLTAEELETRYSDAVEEFYSEGVKYSGLSREQIEAIFEADALRKLLYEEVTGDMPAVEEQVDARHILVETEEEANDILAALAEGESFAELARVSSLDTGSGREGGELGWAGRGRYVAEFEDAVFNAEIGVVVGPIQTQFGYHIIEVHAREERELADYELSQKRQTEFQNWLTELRTNAGDGVVINDYFSVVPGDPTLLDLGLAG